MRLSLQSTRVIPFALAGVACGVLVGFFLSALAADRAKARWGAACAMGWELQVASCGVLGAILGIALLLVARRFRSNAPFRGAPLPPASGSAASSKAPIDADTRRQGPVGASLIAMRKRIIRVVLWLIALLCLAAVVSQVFGGPDHRYRKAAHLRSQLVHLRGVVEQYREDTGSLPLTLVELTEAGNDGLGPYAKTSTLSDPWGVPLYFRTTASRRDFVVFSLGGDGVLGGDGNSEDQQAMSPGFQAEELQSRGTSRSDSCAPVGRP